MVKTIKNLFVILFGAAVMAFGIINFAMTSSLASGGVTGITLILYQLFSISPAQSTLIINIPLHIVFFRFSSRPVFFLTLFGTACLYGFLELFERLGPLVPQLGEDMILAAIGFGVCIGIGTGLIVQKEGTTGGAIIVAKLLKDFFNIPITKTFLIFDGVVILASLYFFVTIKDGIYSLVALYISVIVMNKVQEGFISGYEVKIFSRKHQEIATVIFEKLNRGATYLHSRGAYSNEERDVLMVIVDNKQLIRLKKIVHEVDPDSFVSVSHTYETLGEGFTFQKQGKLPVPTMEDIEH